MSINELTREDLLYCLTEKAGVDESEIAVDLEPDALAALAQQRCKEEDLADRVQHRRKCSEVQELVRRLTEDAGMTPQEISEALDSRVSSRTIYRWARGGSFPGNNRDYEALVELVRQRGLEAV